MSPPTSHALCHSLTVLPDGADELVLRLPQLLHDVLVERVHVLHQPLAGGVVDAARVVQHGEVGLAAEVRLGELRARCARVQIQKGRTTLHCDRMKLCEGVSFVWHLSASHLNASADHVNQAQLGIRNGVERTYIAILNA